jgi:hypothetical protein
MARNFFLESGMHPMRDVGDMQRKCTICGNLFTPRRTNGWPQVTCSSECSAEHQRQLSRRWARANPKRMRELIGRWHEAHPEKAGEYMPAIARARHRERSGSAQFAGWHSHHARQVGRRSGAQQNAGWCITASSVGACDAAIRKDAGDHRALARGACGASSRLLSRKAVRPPHT